VNVFYFAYGSNLDADQMQERVPGSRGLYRARLPDYRLDFTWYSRRWSGGAADIVGQDRAEVWGVVYRLASDDWERLDRFEGGYERFELSVLRDDGEALAVTTYSVREKGRFDPHPQYVEKMLRWGGHWQLPEAYMQKLRSLNPRSG
jgi:gamma-glutamylcyclotransferase (GGCT)/AIG2-like uncharacterized protein YtfP